MGVKPPDRADVREFVGAHLGEADATLVIKRGGGDGRRGPATARVGGAGDDQCLEREVSGAEVAVALTVQSEWPGMGGVLLP